VSSRLRDAREAAGISQRELALRAGVTRALVGSVEQGRHVPAVDAALRLAAALGTTAEALFGAEPEIATQVVTGGQATDGSVVRAATVGDRVVVAPLTAEEDATGWAAADGTIEAGSLALFPQGSVEGALILGCDPALRVADSLSGGRVVGVSATTGEALEALAEGRCHAALVHGREKRLPDVKVSIARWHVARWRVGVAYHPELGRTSLESLLDGSVPLIRRQRSAASDQALVRAALRLGVKPPAGPLAGGHMESARRAAWTSGAAITYEPAAELYGLNFEPLETHVVELWAREEWSAHPGVTELLEVIGSRAFRDRVGAHSGYDLSESGARRAA
jgi:transcriptional regulator with XRE-family HTH domain